MSGYSSFAYSYDKLTENVEYKSRTDYILDVFRQLNHDVGLCLDLACGTGSLSLELANRGIEVIGVDSSIDMLSVAQNKAMENGNDILFLCQKMQELELYGGVDTVICMLDSINHMTSEEDVQETFNRVSMFLNPDGYFLFDVNTIYKHNEILANNTFVYDVDDVFCVWQNTLEDNNIVRINLDLFEYEDGAYFRNSEEFCEKAYSEQEIINMLNKAGLKVVHIFDDMGFEKPKEDSQRIIFVTRKI